MCSRWAPWSMENERESSDIKLCSIELYAVPALFRVREVSVNMWNYCANFAHKSVNEFAINESRFFKLLTAAIDDGCNDTLMRVPCVLHSCARLIVALLSLISIGNNYNSWAFSILLYHGILTSILTRNGTWNSWCHCGLSITSNIVIQIGFHKTILISQDYRLHGVPKSSIFENVVASEYQFMPIISSNNTANFYLFSFFSLSVSNVRAYEHPKQQMFVRFWKFLTNFLL